MSPTPLHNDHEQQKVCHINFTLMGKWPGAAKCTHSPDMEAALLWSQCDWSLLLWDACCTAAGMCWYISDQADHSSGMSLHPVDAYYFHCLLLREHFGSNFEDKLCRGKRKGLFHLPLTFDHCSSVLWKCHLHVHETKLFPFPSEGKNHLYLIQYSYPNVKSNYLQPEERGGQESIGEAYWKRNMALSNIEYIS